MECLINFFTSTNFYQEINMVMKYSRIEVSFQVIIILVPIYFVL